MKRLFFVFALAFTLGLFASCTAHAAGNRLGNKAGIVQLNLNELDSNLALDVLTAGTPVVIEFYDPQDPDTSGECKREVAAFQATVQKYAGRITILRADVHSQNQSMIQRDRIAVCPTHLFVFDRQGNTVTAKRIWGYLGESDFEQLFDEFYQVKP